MSEMLKKLAEASGWTIPDERIQEMAGLYKGTADDTRPVRELELGTIGPAIIYKAD